MKIFFSLLFINLTVFPATYFISNNGQNDKLGTSEATAWQTISKINNSSFNPGDSILFKQGHVWNERLVVPSAGQDGQNIVFGAYGTGAKPVIDVQNNEASVISCWQSYITFQDLVLKNSTNNALGIAVTGGSYGHKIFRVETYNAGNNGISIGKGGGDVHIDSVRVMNSSNNGIHLGGSPDNKLSNVVVENSFVSGTNSNDCITIHEDGQNNSAGSDFIIRNNYCENCAEQGLDLTTGSNVLAINNISKNNAEGGVTVGHSANGVTIQNHTSIDEPTKAMSAAINIGGEALNTKLVYSIIQGNGYHLLRITASNVEIYNNVFAWNGWGAIFDMSGAIESVTVKNNIFTTMQDNIGRVRFLDSARPPDHPSFDFDYNIYYAPSGVTILSRSTGRNYTFGEYRSAFNCEPNSKELDPKFEDRANGNFHLTAESPAIDSAINVGLSSDFDGNPVPHGPAPDIGAFEYKEDSGIRKDYLPYMGRLDLKLHFTNPFIKSVSITFTIPKASPVQLCIYDLSGRLVHILVDGNRPRGAFHARWNGNDDAGRKVANGIYICGLRVNTQVLYKQLVNIK
jgi:hypothetical protein